MHVMPRDDDIGCSAQARADWVHALRNAANAAGVTLTLTRRLIERGDSAAALDMLDRCEAAWARTRELLADAARTTAPLAEPAPATPPREDARAPASPPPDQ